MKKQLQGIALILFGILVALIGILMQSAFQGDYHLLFSIAGGIIGMFGLVFAFVKEK